jgi:signal transduction histidine kinase
MSWEAVREVRLRRVSRHLLMAVASYFPLWAFLCIVLELPNAGFWPLQIFVVLAASMAVFFSQRFSPSALSKLAAFFAALLFVAVLVLVERSQFSFHYLLAVVALVAAITIPMERLGFYVPWVLFSVAATISLWLVAYAMDFSSQDVLVTVHIPATVLAVVVVEIASLFIHLSRQSEEQLFQKALDDSALCASEMAKLRANSDAERFQAITHLAQTIAHDVRSPFSILSLCLQRLKSLKDQKAQEEFIEKVSKDINRSVEKVEALLADLVEFQNKGAFLLEPVSHVHFLRDLLKEFFVAKRGVSVNLSYQLNAERFLVADAARLRKVYQNILTNALQAMKGNGHVWFKTKDATQGTLSFVEIRIGNNGPAIPHHLLPKIFDMLYSASERPGAGLGLSIAKRLVEAMGGTVSVVTNVEHCVEFCLLLPAAVGSREPSSFQIPTHSADFL